MFDICKGGPVKLGFSGGVVLSGCGCLRLLICGCCKTATGDVECGIARVFASGGTCPGELVRKSRGKMVNIFLEKNLGPPCPGFA
jgi:hypothetical protein